MIDGEQAEIRPVSLPAQSPAQMPSVAESPAYPIPPELLNQISGQLGQRRLPAHIREDRPPTPRGYKWRRAEDDGWNLWTRADRDGRSRFVGHFPEDEWHAMRADAPPHRIGFTSGGFVSLASQQKAETPAPLASQQKGKTAVPLASQWKTAKPLISTSKAEKLDVVKSKGNAEAYTVKISTAASFRIRVSDVGFSVLLTWKDGESGKWPERYCCYLSKREWANAKKQSLSAFAGLVAAKIEPTKADLIRRVQSLAS